MASTFRIPKAPLNMRSWLSYAASLQNRGFSDVCELPLAQRKAASETAPQVGAGA
jgi:hypothetical protein